MTQLLSLPGADDTKGFNSAEVEEEVEEARKHWLTKTGAAGQ